MQYLVAIVCLVWNYQIGHKFFDGWEDGTLRCGKDKKNNRYKFILHIRLNAALYVKGPQLHKPDFRFLLGLLAVTISFVSFVVDVYIYLLNKFESEFKRIQQFKLRLQWVLLS